MRPFDRLLRCAITVLSSAAFVAGCGNSGTTAANSDSREADVSYVAERTQMRSQGAVASTLYRSLGEMLPNVRYVAGEEVLPTGVERVVLGRIVEVEAGYGYAMASSEGGTTQIDFKDERAQWRTLRLTVAIDEELASAAQASTGSQLHAGFVIDGTSDPERMTEGLKGLGQVVAFVARQGSPLFSPDKDLYEIADGGAALVTVDESGRLRLPFVEPGNAARLLQGASTLDELRAHAKAPTIDIQVQKVAEPATYVRPAESPCVRCGDDSVPVEVPDEH
jgi:hypothetical protein